MMASGNPFTEPELRSLELLQSIAEANPWLEFIEQTEERIEIHVRGQSRRWYVIEAKRAMIQHFLNHNIVHNTWSLEIQGGARKRDIIHRNQYCANLCLNLRQSADLPVGDKIAALCLSLHNDVTTAMNIHLLAQFLVCPRNDLAKVMIFQDEMVVLHSMFAGRDDQDLNPPAMFDIADEQFNWDDQIDGMERGEEVPDEPVEHEHPRGTEETPPENDPPVMSEEEIEEQRLWSVYEQHMEDIARQEEWDNREP
ncbi:MAG: hypothetical protein QMC59_00245 [Candidatus Poseidoniaceae archaeon]|jgi:hypothetical protein|tara:strand:+ start:102 stop:863 length:762 start_codon:yes stop_codon:yes gene_type:complete